MRLSQGRTDRERFSAWLRGEMEKQGYKTPLGHFCIKEFATQHGLSDVSVGRYMRPKSSVLPGPTICRELAEATGTHYIDVLRIAGYQTQDDLDQYIHEQLATRKWRKVIAEMREAEADDTARTLADVA